MCLGCKKEKDDNEFFIRKRNNKPYGRCKTCCSIDAKERLQKYKQECIEYLGGKCSICGYDKCAAALEMHHPNKDKSVEYYAMKNWSFEKRKDELDKCILVCANCHREIHYFDDA